MSNHDIDHWSDKRIVQTSPRYKTELDALDACKGILAFDDCEYAYVTDDFRVVSIWVHHDNGALVRGQKLSRIPKKEAIDG